MHFIGKHCRVIDSSTTTFWGESIPKTQLSFIFPSGRIETQYLLMSSKPLSVRTLPVKYKVSFREYVLHHAKRIGRVHAANT